LANVVTNTTKRHIKIQSSIQLNKRKQLGEHDKPKLTLIWSYSYDPQSGNKVDAFGEHSETAQ